MSPQSTRFCVVWKVPANDLKNTVKYNEKIKTCKNVLICNPNYTYTRIRDISMSFSETTAKRTTRERESEKNTVCTYFSLQWVASWRVPENTKANHQQTKETLPFLNLIHHSRVSRSTFATKQGLTSPFISNRLHKLHCEKSKSENRRNLSKVEHYCTCLLTGFGTSSWQNLRLFSTALGLMERTTAPWKAVTWLEIILLKKSSQHVTLALNTMLFLNLKDPLVGGTQKAHNSWPIWKTLNWFDQPRITIQKMP